jgi:hypothetical protein
MTSNYTLPVNLGNPIEHTIEGKLHVYVCLPSDCTLIMEFTII